MAEPYSRALNDRVLRLRDLEDALDRLVNFEFGQQILGGRPKVCPFDLVAASLRAEMDVLIAEINGLRP